MFRTLANRGWFAPPSWPVRPPASTGPFWQTRASALARRINVGAWFGLIAPATFFASTVFAVVFYAARRVEAALFWPALAWIVVLLCAAVASWWRSRRSFFAVADARVLLESHLRLDTRLTAAELGLVPWPPVPAEWPAVLQWRLRAPLAWFGAAAGLLALALFAPVPRQVDPARPTGAPPALVQTEALLSALEQMAVAEPKALEQLAERARELARRPAEEQYSHSALEAADAVRNQTVAAAAGLARDLDTAAAALRDGKTDTKGAAGRLAAALAGLRDGTLPANSRLMAGVPAGEADLAGLSAEQLQQLAQKLSSAANGIAGVCGAAGADAEIARPGGAASDRAGAGGPGGGGGSAPLALTAQPSNAGDGELAGVGGQPLKRFAFGDKLGTTSGAHDVDPARAIGPSAAGAVSGAAAGGEAVWVERLTPAERAALKKFFK